jgi:RimJ/RimL family protein N-acetyltransferase
VRVPRLETERLIVRELRPGDEIADVLGERRDDWLRWTVNGYARYAELMQPPYGERGVELRDTGRLVGLVGLVPSLGPFGLLPSLAGGPGDPHRFRPEVGLFWETAPEQRGRGFATEAARALIGHALSALELQRLVATTEHDNLGSIAVMRKLGMRIETNPEGEPEWFQTVGILEAG